MPVWEDIQALAKLEKDNNNDIINEMITAKKNINPQVVMDMLKLDKNDPKAFKPSTMKWDPEITKFLK